jgi:hypothetical protein
MKSYDKHLRWLYRGGQPYWCAQLQKTSTALAFAVEILPWRAAALEIQGRRTVGPCIVMGV